MWWFLKLLLQFKINDHHQFVICDNQIVSTIRKIRCTILGCKLFLVYVNDIHISGDGHHAILFPIDTTFLENNDKDNEMHSFSLIMKSNNKDCWINKMRKYINKTENIVFSLGLYNSESREVNFLLVELDCKLILQSHIRYLCNKLSSKI